jgi:hypothetical protein
MYDQSSESTLPYHELLTEFLEHLCERTRTGPPLGPKNGPIPGDRIYCTTAESFRADLRHAPLIALLSRRVPGDPLTAADLAGNAAGTSGTAAVTRR